MIALFKSNQTQEGDINEAVLALLLAAFIAGAGYVEVDDLTKEDRVKLDEFFITHVDQMPVIMRRWRKGMDMTPTARRIAGFINGAYNFARMSVGLEDERQYQWQLGDTVEHCSDCAEQADAGPQNGSYFKKLAEAGIFPGSAALQCTGLHCQCEVVDA